MMPQENNWIEGGLQWNLVYYFKARDSYDRAHYSNIYHYGRAILRYVDVPKKSPELKKRAELLKKWAHIYDDPLKNFWEKVSQKKKRHIKKVPFSRLELFCYKFLYQSLSGQKKLNHCMELVSGVDLELSEAIDILENFKSTVHEDLMQFLIKNKVQFDVSLMPSVKDFNVLPVGFSNAPKTK